MNVSLGWVAYNTKTGKAHTGGQYLAGVKVYTTEAIAKASIKSSKYNDKTNIEYKEAFIEV